MEYMQKQNIDIDHLYKFLQNNNNIIYFNDHGVLYVKMLVLRQ